MTKILLLVPKMPKTHQLVRYLEEIDSNAQYTNFGPLCERLEERFLGEFNAEGRDGFSAIAVSNCTVGLELALQATGLEKGSRVLVPSLTFVASATAIVRAGMVPVFADVDEHTWALTKDIALKYASLVDAFMPVSTFGYAHDPASWDEVVRSTQKPVVIDAAGAFGNQAPGRLTDVVFSLHATKSFGAGEGGIVVSASANRIRKIKQLSNFGIDTSVGLLAEFGTNAKLSEYHAAVGLAMYDMWEEVKVARRHMAQMYVQELTSTTAKLSFQRKSENGVYPLLPVLLPSCMKAAEVATSLASLGIQTRRWYCPPVHEHPAMRDMPFVGSLAVTREIGARIIGLPFHLDLDLEDIRYVARAVASVVNEAKARL